MKDLNNATEILKDLLFTSNLVSDQKKIMEIKKAEEKEDFLKCWDVVQQLRPHLDQEQYLTYMLYMLDEGYKLIYIEEAGKVLSFCGYRRVTMLYRGRSMYIDDLCTLQGSEGKGYGRILINYVLEQAKKEEMKSVHLDSGHQRYIAHKLYLDMGFKIRAHHFEIEIKKDPAGD